MYLLSLYFQDPASLEFSPLEAGLATLPATAGLVIVAPLVPRLAKRFGGRQVIGVGFVMTTAGFAAIGLADASWVYVTFLLPLVAIAMGMGLSNGPSSSAATACVPSEQVGEASGVSNMARYVGAAVATALAATIYGKRDRQPAWGRLLRRGRPGLRAGRRLVGDDGVQRARHPACPRRHPAAPGRTGHRAGRGGIGCSPPPHAADDGFRRGFSRSE